MCADPISGSAQSRWSRCSRRAWSAARSARTVVGCSAGPQQLPCSVGLQGWAPAASRSGGSTGLRGRGAHLSSPTHRPTHQEEILQAINYGVYRKDWLPVLSVGREHEVQGPVGGWLPQALLGLDRSGPGHRTGWLGGRGEAHTEQHGPGRQSRSSHKEGNRNAEAQGHRPQREERAGHWLSARP